MMRSHYNEEVTPALEGKTVQLAGWVHELRTFGKVNFIILRDRSGLAQVLLKAGDVSDDLIEKAKGLVKETAVLVEGTVKSNKASKTGWELVPAKITVVGEVLKKVPLDITGQVPAEIDTRLDHRFVDLRRPQVQAVFKIRSEIQRAFREKCLEMKMQEINTPSLVEAATEGGTDVFEVKYFEKKAYLAQSPQLYKQLAVVGGMDRVFMTVPIWRAEKHNTTAHLNEVTQMDVELGFADDAQALDALEAVTLHILQSVKTRCAAELALLKQEITVPKKIPRHTYSQLVERLHKSGEKIEWGSDFSKEQEEKLNGMLNEELFFVTHWPTPVRAFYSMPDEKDPKTCKAYDLMYRGLEISSGAQRIHIPQLLIEQLKSRGLDPAQFEDYIDAFRYGAPPHAGWSIGAERLTMKICGLLNVREASLFPRDRNRLRP